MASGGLSTGSIFPTSYLLPQSQLLALLWAFSAFQLPEPPVKIKMPWEELCLLQLMWQLGGRGMNEIGFPGSLLFDRRK